MSFSENTSISPKKTEIPLTHWELHSPSCQRDLVVKKIVAIIVALLNLAVLGAALYYLVSFCPVPAQALFVSPFIVGVLGALAYLKFPTFGVSSINYSNFLNPVHVIGKGLAYVFFGPLTYVLNKVDWTPYHDPIHANRISNELEEHTFEKIIDVYGEHLPNLIKYGFIHKMYKEDLIALHNVYKPIKKELDFWKQEGLEKCAKAKEAEERKALVEIQWKEFKSSFKYPFPHPKTPDLDFSSRKTAIKLKARQYCCIGTPLDFF